MQHLYRPKSEEFFFPRSIIQQPTPIPIEITKNKYYHGFKNRSAAKMAPTKRFWQVPIPIPLSPIFILNNKLWLIHTATTEIPVATPVLTKIAKAFTRAQPFFKTLNTQSVMQHLYRPKSQETLHGNNIKTMKYN